MTAGHARASEIIAAVRACIGTRFRSQGRTLGLGLDCVGVVLIATRAAGMPVPILPRYQIGGDNEARFDCFAVAAGMLSVAEGAPGDVWLFAPVPGQRHFVVQVTAGVSPLGGRPGFVHAHAGVGRVVESPVDPSWVQVGIFRFVEGG